MDTKILHVSDTHLGKKQYNSSIRESDFARAFDVAIDISINESVDAVIHTGDLFDSRSPSTSAVSDAFNSIKRLDDRNIPFYGIVGNHERKWDDQWMDIFETLDNVKRLGNSPKVINNDVSLYGIDSIRESAWDKKDFNIDNPMDGTIICVCMHELFKELVPPVKADKSLVEVIDRMNIKPDIMPLGDYHSAVEKEVDGVKAFYAGATERTSATQEDPTVRIIEIDNQEVKSKWRKIEGVRENVPRPFYPINVDLTEQSTRNDIRRRINENVSDQVIEESVVVVNMSGSLEPPISQSDVYRLMEKMNIKVPYVSDKRTPEVLDFDSVDTADPTSIDMNKMIIEEIDEDISADVKRLDEDVVRDLTVNKSDIRDIVSDKYSPLNEGDDNEN